MIVDMGRLWIRAHPILRRLSTPRNLYSPFSIPCRRRVREGRRLSEPTLSWRFEIRCPIKQSYLLLTIFFTRYFPKKETWRVLTRVRGSRLGVCISSFMFWLSHRILHSKSFKIRPLYRVSLTLAKYWHNRFTLIGSSNTQVSHGYPMALMPYRAAQPN
jgi:hypothetical protein